MKFYSTGTKTKKNKKFFSDFVPNVPLTNKSAFDKISLSDSRKSVEFATNFYALFCASDAVLGSFPNILLFHGGLYEYGTKLSIFREGKNF